jgi:sugar-phosphatase
MPGAPIPFSDRSFAAVLFDMDGTLLDSTPAVVRSWVTWAQEEGVDPRDLAGHHGVPARAIVAKFVAAERVTESLARIEALEVADIADVVPLPGSQAASEALTVGAAQHWAIVTSSTAPLAAARIAAAGLATPDVLVTADDVDRGKPWPDPWLLAAKGLGVDPADCLVVEDAPAGLEAARAAGCATLAVTTTTPRADLVADAVVTDLGEVAFTVVDDRVTVGMPHA